MCEDYWAIRIQNRRESQQKIFDLLTEHKKIDIEKEEKNGK